MKNNSKTSEKSPLSWWVIKTKFFLNGHILCLELKWILNKFASKTMRPRTKILVLASLHKEFQVDWMDHTELFLKIIQIGILGTN